MTVIITPNLFNHSSDTSNCSGSFIKMPTAKILELATAKLQWIKEYRQQKITAHIESIRQEYVNSWWRKLWRMKSPTNEAILKMLKNNICIHTIDWYYHFTIPNTFAAHENACHRLLKVCSDTDEIFISTNDYAYIK